MKKLLTLLMLTAMLLGVVGCGGSAEKKAAYPADGDITVIIQIGRASCRERV